jgi:hypothetical protein
VPRRLTGSQVPPAGGVVRRGSSYILAELLAEGAASLSGVVRRVSTGDVFG